MIYTRLQKFSSIFWILAGLFFSASMCFRDPCEGKWSDASSFDTRGVEWVGSKVGVLGVFTKREKCPNLLGYTYRTLYSRDVMFFVDPSTIHQDENGWWIVEADSVWIIHQEPSIGGGDLWKDPRGRGWWLGRYLYDNAFNHILDSLPCGYHTYPVGDTLYYLCFTGTTGTPDTLKMRVLPNNTDIPLFTFPWIDNFAVSPSHQIYFIDGQRDVWEYRLLRWEGADSFTVIDSPVVSFGFKNDTLVTEKGHSFHLWVQDTWVDSIPIIGSLWSGLAGNCSGTWKWSDNSATNCRQADVIFCTFTSPDTGGILCTTEFFIPKPLWP